MYSIQQRNFGIAVTIEGGLDEGEARSWLAEMGKAVEEAGGTFGVLVDVRQAKLFMPEIQEVLKKGMDLCHRHGMVRAAVVLSSAIATLQARRLARESGIDSWQRYVDASESEDWERKALAWIVSGKDPAASEARSA